MKRAIFTGSRVGRTAPYKLFYCEIYYYHASVYTFFPFSFALLSPFDDCRSRPCCKLADSFVERDHPVRPLLLGVAHKPVLVLHAFSIFARNKAKGVFPRARRTRQLVGKRGVNAKHDGRDRGGAAACLPPAVVELKRIPVQDCPVPRPLA